MYPKYRKWLFLAIVALIPILSGCDGCDKKKYVAPPPAPSAPSNLSGNAVSSTEIDLAWKDNSTNEKGFYLYRKTTNSYARVAILDVNANSYNDTGLNPETSYRYKVRAYNDGGESGSSNEVSITTPAGPEAPIPPLQPPSDVTASPASYKQINLSWRDNSDDEDSFRIACDLGIGENQFLDRVPANTTRYEHGDLQPLTYYQYFVIAERGGESAASERFSATTFEAPVEILYSWMSQVSNRRVYIQGELHNDATEMCLVELTAHIYDQEGDLAGIAVEKFFIEGITTKSFLIDYRIESEKLGVLYTDHTLEITDVEIEY